MPVQFDADGNPSYPEWPAEAVDALAAQLKILDPEKKGIDRSKLRVFYPYLGWNDIQKGLDALVAADKLESKLIQPPGAKVAFEHFVWKGE